VREEAMTTETRSYRVTKSGARLLVKVPDGPSCWRFESRPLRVGEVITRSGTTYWGSVGCESFKTDDGVIGEFEPNSYGVPNRSYIEEVERGTVTVTRAYANRAKRENGIDYEADGFEVIE
jgi:hypothetical protein